MNINKLIKLIESRYPLYSAYDFDNSGANIVDFDTEIKGIVVCLDINNAAIEYAIKKCANVIISHHPLTFEAYKNINDDISSKKIKKLIKNNICAYSCHTNFDVNLQYGMGTLFVSKLFNKSEIKKQNYIDKNFIKNKLYGLGNIIDLKKSIDFDKLITKLKNNFSLSDDKISFYKSKNANIKKVVILPGSGSSEVDKVINTGADCYITSDLKHNQIVDLLDAGVSYINATHYGMEKIFIEYMSKFLKNKIKIDIYPYYDDML